MNTNKRAADVIRALMVVTKTGNRLFSDRTTFGRSIKVWGWDFNTYDAACGILSRHGYNAKIVTKTRRTRRWGNGESRMETVTRLYVRNKVA